MGETAARKRSRQESGVPWTPGQAPTSGDGVGAGHLGQRRWVVEPRREGDERARRHPLLDRCRVTGGRGSRESLPQTASVPPAGPREGGAGTPPQVRAGALHKLLCDAGGGRGVSVSACAWWWGAGGDMQARPL